MHGSGTTTGSRLTLTGHTGSILLTSPGASAFAVCDNTGTGSGASLGVEDNGSAASGASALWWNKDGVGVNTTFAGSSSWVTPGNGSTVPYAVVVQVDNLTSISTFTISERYNPGSDTCSYTGQVVTTNG